jgi:hypothetical protein
MTTTSSMMADASGAYFCRPKRRLIIHGFRAGFRRYWRWKSRSRGGRPQISAELRALIRRMSNENPLWGAPRIHGELLKLGFDIAQSSVAKYMVKRTGPPSQGWRTFLRNHAPDIAAMDLFVVPTIGFDLLYALVIVRRRQLVWINVISSSSTGPVPSGVDSASACSAISTFITAIPALRRSPLALLAGTG